MKALLTALTLLLLAACQTAPPPIGPDASAQIYFQRAQAASDLNQYDEAMGIYKKFLADRPDATHENTFSARYEIAFLLFKKGEWAESKAAFAGILADYDDLDKSQGAPAWVKVLSQKVLQEIQDKEPKTSPKPSSPASS
jgi:tetratricopeptide (TPR) repeat protein